jgi:hypothetical protein
MGDGTTNHVRAYHWVMPWTQIRAQGQGMVAGHMWVPIDDENTMVFNWHYHYAEHIQATDTMFADAGGNSTGDYEANPLWFRDAAMPIGAGNTFGLDIDVEHGFRSTRNADNKYLIDREMQKSRTYTGITGTNTQDRAVQESMGAVADRTLERLGTTDRAIINARRTLLKAVQTVEDGGDPPAVAPTYYRLRAIERVLPTNVHWFEALKPDMYQLSSTKEQASSTKV